MKRALTILLLSALLGAAEYPYKKALPGYPYEFPRDHFSHPDFQTEWWYYTGNLKSAEGHRFGFELTFFRQAIDRTTPRTTDWDVSDAWLAHLALSDIDSGQFRHWERLNRSGPGIAGASLDQRRLWNGNWEIRWTAAGQELFAIAGNVTLRLGLDSRKPPVIHGLNGVSQKSVGKGSASHYISFTRLLTRGTLKLGDRSFEVTGTSWMDHEFFTHQLEADQTGWDWLSLQFEDNTELMLFRLRRRDGTIDPYSVGTYVDVKGHPTHLTSKDFTASPSGRVWQVYPIEWRVQVPSLGIDVRTTTRLDSQELVGRSKASVSYWEGAIDITGTRAGVGYLEMTGYRTPGQPVLPK